ncbi:hypothetical protein ACGFLT_19715 [Micromonospora chalcea]
MAAYLLRVRAEDPKLADSLGWQLQAIPPAWCSLVLPSRTPEQLAAQVAAANARGQSLAKLLGVRWEFPVNDRKRRLLTFAREEAGRRFCQAQADAPGRPVPRSVAAAGRMPGKRGVADVLDSALPVGYSPAWMPGGGGGTNIGGADLRLAYVGILVGSAQVQVRYWPTALPCSLIEEQGLLQPKEISETATNIRELMKSGITTRREAMKKATDFAAGSFDLMETRRQCEE